MGDLDLTGLETTVGELETVVDSAVALMDGFLAEVEAHKDDPAAVQAVVDRFRASKDKLAAAVARNTPAAPTV